MATSISRSHALTEHNPRGGLAGTTVEGHAIGRPIRGQSRSSFFIFSLATICAVLAGWIDLGRIHEFQNGDSVLFYLISLQRWTPFYWEQDRLGTLLPLIALPLRNPLLNLLVQSWCAIFSGIAAMFLLARYVFRHPLWPVFGAASACLFLLFAPARLQFEWFVEQPYGLALALVLGGLVLLDTETDSEPGWTKRVFAFVLVILAHWVNVAISSAVAPLVLLRHTGEEKGPVES